MLQIIGSLVSFGVALGIDKIMAKWLAAWRFYAEQKLDPKMKELVAVEYRALNASIEGSLDKRPPPDLL